MNKPKRTHQDERMNGEKYMIISFLIYVYSSLHFFRIHLDYQTLAVKGGIQHKKRMPPKPRGIVPEGRTSSSPLPQPFLYAYPYFRLQRNISFAMHKYMFHYRQKFTKLESITQHPQIQVLASLLTTLRNPIISDSKTRTDIPTAQHSMAQTSYKSTSLHCKCLIINRNI